MSALRQEQAVPLPTVGFAKPHKVSILGSPVTLFDIGGGHSIRRIWSQYLSDAHGVVFVVDSCDKSRLEEAKLELNHVRQHHYATQKNVLVLANKQDGQTACSQDTVKDALVPSTTIPSLCEST